MFLNHTIVAISTPAGESGIGVIRLSGDDALHIGKSCFRHKTKSMESHKVYIGKLHGAEGDIDEVCFVYLKSPRSYTRQDMVEISCHGSPSILNRALQSLIAAGAKMAEPGEFTKRAFLNGRMDLAQAEGVIDLIKSKSESAGKAALNLMNGGLSTRLETVKDKLTGVAAMLEASLDFPDEELDSGSDETIINELQLANNQVRSLIRSYKGGKLLRSGMTIAIIGKPNAGKSSLLNSLVEEERAIVTEHAGTTRDLIRVEAEIAGVSVELIDTAGLNHNPDEVEKFGIELAIKAAEGADMVIALFDGSRKWNTEDDKVAEELQAKTRRLILINKADLPLQISLPAEMQAEAKSISTKDRSGFSAIEEAVKDAAMAGLEHNFEEPIITRARHLEVLQRVQASLQKGMQDLPLGREITAASVWDALESLKRFTGETYTEDVLSQIFDEFCIGK